MAKMHVCVCVCPHTHTHIHTQTHPQWKANIGKFPGQLGNGERHCDVIEAVWEPGTNCLITSGSLLSYLYIRTILPG